MQRLIGSCRLGRRCGRNRLSFGIRRFGPGSAARGVLLAGRLGFSQRPGVGRICTRRRGARLCFSPPGDRGFRRRATLYWCLPYVRAGFAWGWVPRATRVPRPLLAASVVLRRYGTFTGELAGLGRRRQERSRRSGLPDTWTPGHLDARTGRTPGQPGRLDSRDRRRPRRTYVSRPNC